jgi:hypothetical protein
MVCKSDSAHAHVGGVACPRNMARPRVADGGTASSYGG